MNVGRIDFNAGRFFEGKKELGGQKILLIRCEGRKDLLRQKRSMKVERIEMKVVGIEMSVERIC